MGICCVVQFMTHLCTMCVCLLQIHMYDILTMVLLSTSLHSMKCLLTLSLHLLVILIHAQITPNIQ